MFDVLIIGGGVSGVSAALIFGSAKEKPFMSDKKIGIIVPFNLFYILKIKEYNIYIMY